MVVQPASEQSWVARIFRGPAREWIWDRTIALYFRTETGRPTMKGSGVLLKIADAAFILSAGHVLKHAQDMEIQIGPMAKGSRVIKPQDGQVGISPDLDDVDIGFVRLSEETASELAVHKKFTRMNNLDLHLSEPCDGAYCFLGFPQRDNSPDYDKNRINPTPFHYLCEPLRNPDEAKPGINVLFKVTKDIVILSDLENSDVEEQRMPELNGISGCGMWRLFGVGDRADHSHRWDPSWIRLVGIEHTWARRKWVKGTFIRQAINLIANTYPELRTSIELTW